MIYAADGKSVAATSLHHDDDGSRSRSRLDGELLAAGPNLLAALRDILQECDELLSERQKERMTSLSHAAILVEGLIEPRPPPRPAPDLPPDAFLEQEYELRNGDGIEVPDSE